MSEATGTLSAQRPWPGLDSFTEQNRDYFHGREREAEELLRLVRSETLTSLFGQSGLGKTSLLRAGLYPLLRVADFLPVHLRLDLTEAAPDLRAQVLSAAAAEAAAHGVEIPEARPGETLWAYFHRRGNRWWSGAQPIIPVLVFDQFEEIFSLGRATPERFARCQALVDELGWLVEGVVPPDLAAQFAAGTQASTEFAFDQNTFRVLFAFREDFLADFESLRGRIRSLFHSRLRLTRFTPERALEVVDKVGGHLFAPGVAPRVIDFIAGGVSQVGAAAAAARGHGDVEPALLSLVCEQLNEQRIARKEATISGELLDSSRESILTGFYARATAGLDPQVKVFIEERLVTGSGYRNQIPRVDALREPGITPEVIETLVARRLLRVDPGSGIERIELIHDVLTGVVLTARRRRRAETDRIALGLERARIRRRARLAYATIAGLLAASVLMAWMWKDASDAKDRAEQATSKANETTRKLEKTLADLKVAEEDAQEQAKIASKQAEVATAQAAIALEQTRVAQASTRRMIAADKARNEAVGVLTGRGFATESGDILASGTAGTSIASLLAVGAARLAPDRHESLRAVLTARAKTGDVSWLRDLEIQPSAVAIDRYRQRVAIGLSDGSIEIRDARTGEKEKAQPPRAHTRAIFSLAYSADGRRLLSGSDDNTFRVWDAATGQAIGGARKRHSDSVRSIAFSSDGNWIVSGGDDSAVYLWPADSETPLRQLGGGERVTINALAYSPDGTTLVTGEESGRLQVHDPSSGKVVAALLPGHARAVSAVAFSRDGTRIATAGEDRLVRLWNATTREPIAVLEGHDGNVNAVAFNPDGSRLVSGSNDRTMRMWDGRTGKPIGEPLKGHTGAVLAVAFSPDGRWLVSGSGDQTVRVWNGLSGDASGEPLRGHTDFVRTVAVNREGTVIASGSDDRTIRLWSLQFRTLIRAPLIGHEDWVRSLAFSPDGSRLVSGADDRTLRAWNAQTGAQIGRPWAGHRDFVYAVAFSPDGSRVASGASEDTLRLWDAGSGTPITQTPDHLDYVRSVAFNPNGRSIASAAEDGVRLWTIDGRLATQLSSARVNSIAFSVDGSRLVAGGEDGSVRAWDVTGTQPRPLGVLAAARGQGNSVMSVIFAENDPDTVLSADMRGGIRRWSVVTKQVTEVRARGATTVQSVSLNADGRSMVEAREDRSVGLWRDGEVTPLTTSLPGMQREVFAVAASPVGDTVLAGGIDPEVKMLALSEARKVAGQPPPPPAFKTNGRVWAIAVSPDATRLAIGGDAQPTTLWSVPERRLIRSFGDDKDPGVRALAFNPREPRWLIVGNTRGAVQVLDTTGSDVPRNLLPSERFQRHTTLYAIGRSASGNTIVTAGDRGRLLLWDFRKGQPTAELVGHQRRNVVSVAFSPKDESSLVSGGEDGTLTLWNTEAGKLVAVLRGHDRTVHAVAFTPDGRRIVSGGADGTIRIWDAHTGRALIDPIATGIGTIRSIAVSADAERVIAGGTGGMLRVLNLDMAEHVDTLCRQVGREITPDEWKRYAEGSSAYRPVCSPNGPATARR